jgi:hypothetical protein
MVPPISTAGVYVGPPLSKWIVFKTYDSLHQCVVGQAELQSRAQGDTATPHLDFPQKQLQQFNMAQCVSGGDPRLKNK